MLVLRLPLGLILTVQTRVRALLCVLGMAPLWGLPCPHNTERRTKILGFSALFVEETPGTKVSLNNEGGVQFRQALLL